MVNSTIFVEISNDKQTRADMLCYVSKGQQEHMHTNHKCFGTNKQLNKNYADSKDEVNSQLNARSKGGIEGEDFFPNLLCHILRTTGTENYK